ncbi:hypothetical protein, partial [Campylobacter concisus]|uniref:hypothetical protein n=1 Tax=Campylobacter concisus TaxID=199 RepID=UPI001CB80D76
LAGATSTYSFWAVIERAAFACFSVFDISVVSVLFNISIFAFLLIRFISSLAFRFETFWWYFCKFILLFFGY